MKSKKLIYMTITFSDPYNIYAIKYFKWVHFFKQNYFGANIYQVLLRGINYV